MIAASGESGLDFIGRRRQCRQIHFLRVRECGLPIHACSVLPRIAAVSSSPAYVPRHGVSAAEVIDIVARAGGIASLAHPVLAKIDGLIPGLASHGLAALEARHSDHNPETEARYRAMARELGLGVSGGSDFHGDETSNAGALGVVTLDRCDFDLLTARVRDRH